MFEFLKGGVKFVLDKVSNEIEYGFSEFKKGNIEPAGSAALRVMQPLTNVIQPALDAEDIITTEAGKGIEDLTGGAVPALAGSLLVGAVMPGPGEIKSFAKGAARLQFRPNVTGMRNADARAILGDWVTDPAAVAARPGRRLESDPTYKLLQKGRAPEPKESMSKMPNFMSPHHRVDVKGSIPFFEGSTEAANVQRRADLAVGDIYPGNDPRNYIGLWDGPLSGKASKKTGVYSTDHQDVHKAMENLRRQLGLKAKGGTDVVAELPDNIKTGLLADLSMRDELAANKVLATRMDMIHEAFPDMSYDEIKDTILNNPKRFANLSRTSEGYLYSLIAP